MNYTSEFTGPQIDERLGLAGTAYQKPETGIPAEDLSEGVQEALQEAGTAYQKPETGIPKTDLSSEVAFFLDKARTALQSVKSIGGVGIAGVGSIPVVFDIKSTTRLGLRLDGVLVANQEFKTVNGVPVIGSGDIEIYDVLNIQVGTTDPAIIAKAREFARAHKPVIAWEEEVPYYLSYGYDGEDLVFTHYDAESKWIYGYRVNDAETPITWNDADFNLSIVEALSMYPVFMGDDTEFIELDSHAYDALRQADVVVNTVTELYYKKNPALSPLFITHNFGNHVPGTAYTIDVVAGAWANSVSYEFMLGESEPDVVECDILLLVTYDNGTRFGLIKIVV